MAINELPRTVTLETIIGQVHSILDTASNNRRDLEGLADEVCGAVPQAVEQATMDRPIEGRLSLLANLLEILTIHQDNTRAAVRRLERSLGSQSAAGNAVGTTKAPY